MRDAGGRDRGALATTAVTMVLWASAFVVIREAGRYPGPGPLALGRMLAGSAVLAAIVAVRREGLPPRAAWPGIAGFGVLRFGVKRLTEIAGSAAMAAESPGEHELNRTA